MCWNDSVEKDERIGMTHREWLSREHAAANCRKVLIVGALPSSLVNFRGDLIRMLTAAGHHVTAMASKATASEIESIRELGAEYIDYPVSRNSVGVFDDMRTLIALVRVLRALKPDVVLAYTIKPIVWGGIAVRLVGNVRFYGLVTGLGFAFHGKSWRRRILRGVVVSLYRLALRHAAGVIFQNEDNRAVFLEYGIVNSCRAHTVNGSGVNVERFARAPFPDGPPVFLVIARLLGEKGLREYAAAARCIKKTNANVTFRLIGPEESSADGIPIDEVLDWVRKGAIEYPGAVQDVRSHIENCHVFILPSYHEGLPRTVIEAMAIGRPILTTDVPGCRETVRVGENGFLVPSADADALADRIFWFLENRSAWEAMANRSRELAEQRFDVHKINGNLCSIMGLSPVIKP